MIIPLVNKAVRFVRIEHKIMLFLLADAILEKIKLFIFTLKME